MLQSLTIENVILIERLHIDFKEGLCVLTGETGAGKSILLDALGFALGARAEGRLLRQNAPSAQVTACFLLPSCHPLWTSLEDQGFLFEGGELIFRRHLNADGRSKCFLNDQLISQTLLRQIGQDLVEVHGQRDRLLDPKIHLDALDVYGKIEKKPLRKAFQAYRRAKKDLKDFEEKLSKSLERQTFLRFAIEDIEKVNPSLGEEDKLEGEKALISHHAKIAEALLEVEKTLDSALSSLAQSHKTLNRIQDLLPEKLSALVEGCDRALVESQDVNESLRILNREVEDTPCTLETLENRLYDLRTLSRKYQTKDILSSLATYKKELEELDHGEDQLLDLKRKLLSAKTAYEEKAYEISEERMKKAKVLEAALSQELPLLKLPHARFRVHFEDLSEDLWGEEGKDRIVFYIKTNPGSPEGSLSSIASGGELSRFMLALKTVLAQSATTPTLIFDEIESGTGGAISSAMGERLATLSEKIQVLAITHSPQIAAYGQQHFIVYKLIEEGQTTTHIKPLESAERYEEIARMLAGEEVTEEARAAAKRLFGGT